LREQLKNDGVDVGRLESEVYDHLFSFFRRYYSEGDFLAKRVYKPGVYAIPYEGEEVMLHWANKDQYYIKTSEYLRDYAFRLRPDLEEMPMRVHFRLADVAEGEHGNVKASEGKERRFKLADENPVTLEPRRTSHQQLTLDSPEAQGAESLKEQYILRYMLDVETRGSQSLLNVQAFTDPTAYKLKVKRPGSDESSEVNIDLLESFNWLVGLTVRKIAAPQSFTALFERDSEKRLRLHGPLKPEADAPYWFRTVTGTVPDGRKVLIIIAQTHW